MKNIDEANRWFKQLEDKVKQIKEPISYPSLSFIKLLLCVDIILDLEQIFVATVGGQVALKAKLHADTRALQCQNRAKFWTIHEQTENSICSRGAIQQSSRLYNGVYDLQDFQQQENIHYPREELIETRAQVIEKTCPANDSTARFGRHSFG